MLLALALAVNGRLLCRLVPRLLTVFLPLAVEVLFLLGLDALDIAVDLCAEVLLAVV
jgi:hypothetical protein